VAYQKQPACRLSRSPCAVGAAYSSAPSSPATSRTCLRVRGGTATWVRTPRSLRGSSASETAPGNPRPPGQGVVDGAPGQPRRFGHRARIRVGPPTRLAVVGIRPGQDLLDGQLRQVCGVEHAPPLGQQQGQGRAARQAALPVAQGHVHRHPGFPQRRGHWAAARVGPAAVVVVGPGQHLASASAGRPLRLRTPLRAASRRAREEPPGRPRAPECRASLTADQVSPPLPGMRPDLRVGHAPVALCWSSAQARTCSSVRGGSWWRWRAFLCWARSWARELPPGSPRSPRRSARSRPAQVSPHTPRARPAALVGHRPVVSRWASALCRISWRTRGRFFPIAHFSAAARPTLSRAGNRDQGKWSPTRRS
jgi:hypothetical protein